MKDVQLLEVPDGRSIIKEAIALVGMAVAVALAVALWQMATAISIGLLCIGVGIGLREAAHGWGYIILMKRRGDAELAEALASGQARMMLAERSVPQVVIYGNPDQQPDGAERTYYNETVL